MNKSYASKQFLQIRYTEGMPKARDYHLSEQQLAEIEKATHQDKRSEVRQHSTVIRLLHLGHKPKVIAEMQAISIPIVYGWLKRWQQDGIEGLANRPKFVRPAKAEEGYSRALQRVLGQEPKAIGFTFAIWTVDRLRAHLEKETGTPLSEPQLRASMKHKGYQYRRPKHDLGHLQDKEAKAQAAELLEEPPKRSA